MWRVLRGEAVRRRCWAWMTCSDARRGCLKAVVGGSRYGCESLLGLDTLIRFAFPCRLSSSARDSSDETGSLLRFPLVSSNSSVPESHCSGAVTMFLMAPKNELERARGAVCWLWVLIAVGLQRVGLRANTKTDKNPLRQIQIWKFVHNTQSFFYWTYMAMLGGLRSLRRLPGTRRLTGAACKEKEGWLFVDSVFPIRLGTWE